MPRQAFPDTRRRLLMGYRPCGQTVVSENAQILNEDVSLGAVRLLAVPCLALQKAVQIFLSLIAKLRREHLLDSFDCGKGDLTLLLQSQDWHSEQGYRAQ